MKAGTLFLAACFLCCSVFCTAAHARYFDVVTGRFMAVDPAPVDPGSNIQSFNRYAYGNNNPYKFIDLDGRISIFVGGAGDSIFKPVLSAFKKYNADDPNSAYFGHSEGPQIQQLIDSQPVGEPINLIGHSLGGATAADIAATSDRRVNTLITIDPVGIVPSFDAIRKNTDMWVNVNAAPTTSNFSDTIAGLGYKWGNSPQGSADSHITAKHNHAEFNSMMNTGGPGARSPAEILRDATGH